jgi:hypothetical protein
MYNPCWLPLKPSSGSKVPGTTTGGANVLQLVVAKRKMGTRPQVGVFEHSEEKSRYRGCGLASVQNG